MVLDYLLYLAGSEHLYESSLTTHLSVLTTMRAFVENPFADLELASIRRQLRAYFASPTTAVKKHFNKERLPESVLGELIAGLSDTLYDKRTRAMALLVYFGGMTFAHVARLMVGNITYTEQGITIEGFDTSKKTATTYHLDRRGDALCPVFALDIWLRQAGIKTGIVFRSLLHQSIQNKPVAAVNIEALITLEFRKAGLLAKGYSYRSLLPVQNTTSIPKPVLRTRSGDSATSVVGDTTSEEENT